MRAAVVELADDFASALKGNLVADAELVTS